MNAAPDTACVVDAVMRQRKSVRAFKPDAVSREQVQEILAIAGTAPSNSNTQPWRVHVLAGAAKQALSAVLLEAHISNAVPPFANFPDPLPADCAARQDDFGRRYYQALGIDRADTAARARQTGRNFAFFDAPVGLIFTIAASLKPHSWLDYGLFVQNVMLAASARGLATCPQGLVRAVSAGDCPAPVVAAGADRGLRHVHGLRRAWRCGEPSGHAARATRKLGAHDGV